VCDVSESRLFITFFISIDVLRFARDSLTDAREVSIRNPSKVNQSHYRPEVPRGFQEVKVPRLRDSGPG